MRKLDRLNELFSLIKAEDSGQNSSLELLNNNLMRTAASKNNQIQKNIPKSPHSNSITN